MERNEKILQEKLTDFMNTYFYVNREVSSTDGKSRIDLMLVHKSDKERMYPVGIEIKVTGKKRGKDLANWIKQAHRYSESEFVGYGKCMIIAYPQISGLYLREGVEMCNHESINDFGKHNNVGTFIGQFKIGELQKYKDWNNRYLCRIVYCGSTIWDMSDNVLRINNYKRFLP